MKITYLPLYSDYFQNPSVEKDWENFKTRGRDFYTSLAEKPVDFSVEETRRENTPSTPLQTLFSILSAPIYAIYAIARYILQRLIMIPLYPAQSRIVKYSFPGLGLDPDSLNKHIKKTATTLNNKSFIVRDLARLS